jgi:kinesin family protein 1
LKIRETKRDGIYVEDLIRIPVMSYFDIDEQIKFGTTNRTVAHTDMNATSSRAHTVTTITFKQTFYSEGKPTNQTQSNINLVDLAGSERQKDTNATSDRLKEGSNINKSLSFLGKVINILAEKASGKKSAKNAVVPYRESKLTRILQNALGGNSKTAMIAAISPADDNYEESLSTLIYANQVKSIKNNAKKNESPQDKLIRELREENEQLKLMMEKKSIMRQEAKEDKEESDDVMKKVRIMNVSDDPMLTGQIHHAFKNGVNVIGRVKKGKKPDIPINGLGMNIIKQVSMIIIMS